MIAQLLIQQFSLSKVITVLQLQNIPACPEVLSVEVHLHSPNPNRDSNVDTPIFRAGFDLSGYFEPRKHGCSWPPQLTQRIIHKIMVEDRCAS